MVSFVSPNLLELKKSILEKRKVFEDLTRCAYNKTTWCSGKTFDPGRRILNSVWGPQNPDGQELPWKLETLETPKKVPRSPEMKSCLFSIFNEKFHKVWEIMFKKAYKLLFSAMSNTWVAKIKASLLMSAQSWFFPTRLQFTHPSSFQPLSCSFIHLPSQVPTSSNIHVRHVTKVRAAGEGQLHHSSLLVGCQSGIKPTVNVCWKSERDGSKHGTFIMGHVCNIIKSISISGMNMAQPMQ